MYSDILSVTTCGCTRKETTKQGFEYYITSGYNYTLKDGKAVLIEKRLIKMMRLLIYLMK